MMKHGQGWHGEPGRHSLAARGVRTRSTVLLSPGGRRDAYARRKIREKMAWIADSYIRGAYYDFHGLTVDGELPMGSDFVEWFNENYLDIDSMKAPLNHTDEQLSGIYDLNPNQQNLLDMKNAVLLEMIKLHVITYDDAVELGYTIE